MKFCYTVAFSIKGVHLLSDEKEKDIIVDPTAGLRAVITCCPDAYLYEGDRYLAVAMMMLRGLVGEEPADSEFKLRVENAIDEVKAARQKKFGSTSFLVVIGEGTLQSFCPEHERDAEEFTICIGGVDHNSIRLQYLDRITTLINCFVLETNSVVGVKKVTESTIVYREDAKPIYSYNFTGGTASAYGSRPLSHEQVLGIGELYRLMSNDKSLQRVQHLIRASFETEDDLLRSFLTSWSAFEIFVNKVFSGYENSFFESILEEGRPDVQRKYLKRIQEVMKDKYRLADKFAAISFQLAPETSDEDLKTVLQVKKIRDELQHGESVNEAKLPVKPIRNLVSKYLRLHIESVQLSKG